MSRTTVTRNLRIVFPHLVGVIVNDGEAPRKLIWLAANAQNCGQ